MRLSAVGVTISSAERGHGEPGVRAGRRHLGQRGQQSAQLGPMLVQPPAQVGPPGVVEQGEGQVGLEDGVADLGGVVLEIHGEGAASRPAGTTTAASRPPSSSRRTVARASAPTMSPRSRSPAPMAAARSAARTWGTEPPMPE